MAQPGRKEVKLSELAPQQLSALKEQLEGELEGLNQSSITLQTVASEFHRSGEAVQQLSQHKVGQPMLLPLTQSLYVEGELADAENVLLDIGTGYYVEKPHAGGVDYCKRKVQQMADNLKEIQKVRSQKMNLLMAVDQHLQQHIKQAQQQQAAAASKQGVAVAT